MKLACRSALTLAALLAGTGAALAEASPESPVGQWNVTLYGEPSLAPAGSFPVCFKADHTWYDPDFPVRGSWFGEGDELRWYGTAAPGSDSFAIANHDHFIRKNFMTGVFDEFDLTTGTGLGPPANEILQRTTLTCDPPPTAGSHTGTGKFLR